MVRTRGEAPSWGITKLAACGTIWLRFDGAIPTPQVSAFINALSEMMPPSDAHIVFDLRRLGHYNPEIREPLKAWLRGNKPRIAKLTVLASRSATIVKMVSAAMALATGVKIRIRDDVDEDVPVAQI